ncbi:uncharacterized protein BO88DRAFT_266977 [Aspergillus vadensis CBS 113365]|uniref:Uncharacterized protein n=1 Tax=Aspergillus vadensis (strain CBS 113365 / IMI 142717 / IBT 24658) TaxID=1448311 RepID=A0A319BG33_ASPVC|nr:hypothetical protein BO88DRAFT_266977 [Aspergillus vadensis CBS 113365]PYH69760.1 hypothetical protein BO88DRAFT_266977 [Aspergillus vadensis CBS 113365]
MYASFTPGFVYLGQVYRTRSADPPPLTYTHNVRLYQFPLSFEIFLYLLSRCILVPAVKVFLRIISWSPHFPLLPLFSYTLCYISVIVTERHDLALSLFL